MRRLLFLALALSLFGSGAAHADSEIAARAAAEGAVDGRTVPAALEGVDIVEHLGASVPQDLTFIEASGRSVTLKELFGRGKPVLLTLAYFDCPMLCSLVMNGTGSAVRAAGLEPGLDFIGITVSFNPKDTAKDAALRQQQQLQAVGYPDSAKGWPYLVSADEKPVRALADAVGFKYRFDPRTKQFAHNAAIFVLTPEGKVSRYLYGVQFSPRDVKLALLEAAGGRVGTTFDKVLLSCFQYDPAKRTYALFVRRFIQAGGSLVFLGLAITLGVFWRREVKGGRVT